MYAKTHPCISKWEVLKVEKPDTLEYDYTPYYILKVNKYEDTFEAIVGTIFHKILSMCFENDIDIIRTYESEIEKSDYEFSESEKFFLSILKDEWNQQVKQNLKNKL